ncbi:MAG: PH domain-containing protein [Gammaproteobacteria bacterium]
MERKETVIRSASFDPKVRTYWLLSGALVFILTLIGIPLLLLWFPIGFYFTGRYLDRMECVLTSKTLKVKKGLLVRVEKTIPLEKITDMALVQGPIMRWLGIDKLTVETAGQSGAGALVSLTGIVRASEFREAVLDQRDLLAEKSGHQVTETGPPAPSTPDAGIQELRDAVLRIEALLTRIADRDRTPED